MRTRIAGLIIRDKKLLLLKPSQYEEFWTPGGSMEDETEEECLARELKEEINADLVSCEFFGEFLETSPYSREKVLNRTYLAEVEGDLRPREFFEEIVWAAKDDMGKYEFVDVINKIMKELIRKKLL